MKGKGTLNIYAYGSKAHGINAGEYFESIIPNIAATSVLILTIVSIIYVLSVMLLHRNYNSKIEDEKTHPLLTTILSFIPSLLISVFVVIGYII